MSRTNFHVPKNFWATVVWLYKITSCMAVMTTCWTDSSIAIILWIYSCFSEQFTAHPNINCRRRPSSPRLLCSPEMTTVNIAMLSEMTTVNIAMLSEMTTVNIHGTSQYQLQKATKPSMKWNDNSEYSCCKTYLINKTRAVRRSDYSPATVLPGVSCIRKALSCSAL